MAKEQIHQYEYKHHTVVKNARQYSEEIKEAVAETDLENKHTTKLKEIKEAVAETDLENKHTTKLKKNKKIKLMKFREGTAHFGRAKAKRKIVDNMGVPFIDDPKLRALKERID